MLDVLFWGLKASYVARTSFKEALWYVNCNFWSKHINKFFSCIFSFSFWSSIPQIRIRIHLKFRIRFQRIRIRNTGTVYVRTCYKGLVRVVPVRYRTYGKRCVSKALIGGLSEKCLYEGLEMFLILIFLFKFTSVVDPDPYPDPDWIRIQWGHWIRIRIRI